MTAQGDPAGRLEAWRARGRRIRNEWRTWLNRRTGIGMLTALVVVAIVANALPNGVPQPTNEPGPTARPTETPEATIPPEQAWGDLTLPAWEPVAELRPMDRNASGVAIDSAFILHSRTSTPAAALAAGLTAEPAVAFAIQPGDSPAEVMVVPAEPLTEGVLYRFRLADPTGALAGSWAYRTERPLHVVGTVPGDRTTDVPANTGIEVEFDQDGVADIADWFSIEPAVPGRFEVHARTGVFVPTQPLAPSAVYRVTIAAGVTLTGSDQVLEAPVTFAFETAAPGGRETWDVGLGRPILEAKPGERPMIGVDLAEPESATPRTSLPFEVYRLPSFEAARTVADNLSVQRGWGEWSGTDLVPTAGLVRVAAFDGAFESESPYGYKVVRFPAPLDAGWYLVVVPRDGRDRQALLQVTGLSAFALTSETRTLAWVNDTTTGEPIAGAVLLDRAGARVGSTGTDGLIDVETPASLLRTPADEASEATTIVTVAAPDGRRLIVTLGLRSNTSAYSYERNSWTFAEQPDRRWWLLLSTDRTTYRSTDTVHAWGLIRSRADATVPAGLELTLRTADGSSTEGPWLARVPVTATGRGAWVTDIELDHLPLGGYILELRAAGKVASSTWISVDEIRKPAYEIEVETDHLAVIAGDPVTITGHAAFFDGTSAAGLDLRIDAFERTSVMTADAEGRVTLTVPARADGTTGFSWMSVGIRPALPEEGEISGYTNVVVFPSAAWLEASGAVRDRRVVVDGTISLVDLERVQADLGLVGWPEDPSGAPITGATVTIRVVEMIPVKKQVGTTYDYIEKRAVPIFEYSTNEKAVGTYTTTSGAGGAISISVPAPNADHDYLVTLTSRDGSGRTTTTVTSATDPARIPDFGGPFRPYLGKPGGCGYYSEEHAVGDTVSLTMRNGDGTESTGGRYLFVVAGRGIRDAHLQESPTISRTYGEADLPSLQILAIRFQDGAYVVSNDVLIRTRLEDRTLGVELTSDRNRYKPGDRATVSVRTTDADGRPISADVVIRGVDEKLFSIGQAFDIDALATLLAPTGDGLLQSYASHPIPLPFGGDGCGDTAGGGRDDFRDSVLFQLTSTGSDGIGSVTFDLSDDLTSWHLSATALSGDLRAGSGVLLVPVGLPFFADAILASDYLVGERPVLRVRSFGDALATGDRVRFTVTASSLLLPPTSVEAAAFATATIQLPNLPLGGHEVTIEATVIGDKTRTDTLIRKLIVRSSRLEVARTQVTTPAAAAGVGGSGLTTYVVTDAGRGSLVPVLQDLAHGSGARFDRLLAADLAHDLLVGSFGFDASSLPPVDFDVRRYERNGIALLPYSSPDLSLTAMAAIVAPERLPRDETRQAFRDWKADPSTTRERQVIATAGLAGLGDDVIDELHAIDVGAVSVREALWVALGLVAVGDLDGARVIEQRLLDEHGQELGPWVRLDDGGSIADTLNAASLLALTATAVGDPLAPRIDRYVREMRTSEGLYVLPEIGVILWSLDRLPRAAARFAWTADGARHTERLEPGESWTVALTERQRDGFRLESLDGAIAVIASWSAAPGPGDLPSGDLVTITRTVTPADDAPTTGLVKVRLQVVFDAKAPTGCWEVTDRTPSGLAPIVNAPGWGDGEVSRNAYAPFDVSGQRVSWCIDPSHGRVVLLGYSARVVSAGTFAWEPAVVQSATAPDVGATTPVTTYTIR